MEILGKDNLPEFVTAWTQGGLDAAQAELVQAWLRDHPESAAEIEASVRLNTEARRALTVNTPASLRDRIAGMRSEEPAPKRIGPMRRWAWAASIAVAIGLGMMVGHAMNRPPANTGISTADVIPAGIVTRVDRIHAMCARAADNLHANGYPTDAGALPADVAADTHGEHPDLSSIGFRYIGAGPCGDTLPGTVHLLYKSVQPGFPLALSLFVQENHGQFPIEPGRLYKASGDRDPFPMYVWRTDKVVYFLIADNETIARKAMGVIAGAPR
jgi:hypothetical protein